MTQTNRQWLLARRPRGAVSDDDFKFEHGEVPTPADGEVVVRTRYISMDPTNRAWMNEQPTYMEPIPLGAPMRAFVMGEVVASASDKFAEGDKVTGIGGWCDYFKAPAGTLSRLPAIPGITGKEVFGIYSIVGPTAYFGMHDIGRPKIGETLVVSGAAGAVGSLAGQFGKFYGCRVIGIAGGREKCGWVVNDFGMDAAIDYKSEDVAARLDELCPDGIDIYFDNVGGDILDAALARMNVYGRIVQCGAISMYNAEGPTPGPSNYLNIVIRRLTVQGFVILDYFDRYPEAYRALTTLRKQGRLEWKFDEFEGLDNALDALRSLFTGGNTGKVILEVD
ncbi:alcohol dehydrogenase zinc-binding domain-containing protein [Salinisphaera sp. PC39]|uniref:NADP-dependent oxidoreductase n=1 Tax=Salinisphaera sp. PC39 TaxID=1304156 RepID=UPI00333FE10C